MVSYRESNDKYICLWVRESPGIPVTLYTSDFEKSQVKMLTIVLNIDGVVTENSGNQRIITRGVGD